MSNLTVHIEYLELPLRWSAKAVVSNRVGLCTQSSILTPESQNLVCWMHDCGFRADRSAYDVVRVCEIHDDDFLLRARLLHARILRNGARELRCNSRLLARR